MEVKEECCNCGKPNDEDENFLEEKGDKYCYECYNELFQFECVICEEHCYSPTKPKDHYVYLHIEQDNYKPGYYQVIKFPVYTCCIVDGWLNGDALKLISTNVCYKADGELDRSGYICKDCFKEKGIDKWRIEKHIVHFVSQEHKRIGEPKNWTKIIVEVSKRYFDKLEGKVSFKKVQIKLNLKNKVQELKAEFKLQNNKLPK